MAHRTTLEEDHPARTPKAAKKSAAANSAKTASNGERERVFDAFRRWGYLEATLDPLGLFEPLKHPDLHVLTGEVAEEARRVYCNTIGADFMPLSETERRHWIADRLRTSSSPGDPHKIL